MFREAKNIDTAFKQLRSFSLLCILSVIGLCSYVSYKCVALVREAQGKIYILSSGKALEAFAAERKDNIPVEAKDHIKVFHQFFFSLDPDEKLIRANIARALYLADGSAKQQYDDLREANYYMGVISGNVSQTVAVDSIVVDVNEYPYRFRCYSTLKVIRSSSTVLRNLITEGQLRNQGRSENNPHGFLIERWVIMENRDIKTESR